MRWMIGSCALATAAALAGPAPAFEDVAGWGPFKLHMTLAQAQAIAGFAWSETSRFHPTPGHDWVAYRAQAPVSVEGKPFELTVSFFDDGLSEIRLRRALDLPQSACRGPYDALMGTLEKRYGPSEPAVAYSDNTHSVLDGADGEDAVVERHPGLRSTSTVYRTYEVPNLVRTQFGPQGASVREELRLKRVEGVIRCTDLLLIVR